MERGKKNKYILLLLLAVVTVAAIAAGCFYANSRSEKDILDEPLTGGVKEISLLDESIEAQRVLDTILLQKNNWQLIEKEHTTKDAVMTASQNKVQWKQRKLAVGVPASTNLSGAGKWLREELQRTGLEYISGSQSSYKDWDAFKVDAGIAVKAGTGKKYFITDTIYFFHNSNLNQPDKDIKKERQEAAVKKPVRHYKGKLAVIIDDCGYDLAPVKKLLATGLPFSYAILPYKPYSSEALEIIKNSGKVPMLHLPMEPMDKSAMSEGARTVRVDMSKKEIIQLTRSAVESLPGILGVNNHQGSRATSDEATMKIVLQELKKQNLFFVDSGTYTKSLGDTLAEDLGILTARNNIFLDNSSEIEAIHKQIVQAMEMADANGSAIAICHARPNTAKAWSLYAEEVRNSGIELVPVTELLH